MNTQHTTLTHPIKSVFQDHWGSFIQDNSHLTIRPVVFREVQRMIDCQTSAMGYSTYECPDCLSSITVYNSCKSRFCNSCGTQYSKKRALAVSKKVYHCSHRHIVFTIPQELRVVFMKDRTLFNLLFKAVQQTLLGWFLGLNKAERLTPGFISVLHTYGRSCVWNPHIHVLCTEGAMGRTCVFRIVKHISFVALRKRFQTALLSLLEKHFGKKDFRPLKNKIYANTQNGFYVYAKANKNVSNKELVKYILRYTGKPVMAESRIIDYDGEFITFFYHRHEDGVKVTQKLHAYDFIKLLIRHIPNRNFKMIRYYGIYSKKHIHHDKMFKMFSDMKIKFMETLTYWRTSLVHDFNKDPLICPSCGATMVFSSAFFP